jgi:hypothetical protein
VAQKHIRSRLSRIEDAPYLDPQPGNECPECGLEPGLVEYIVDFDDEDQGSNPMIEAGEPSTGAFS